MKSAAAGVAPALPGVSRVASLIAFAPGSRGETPGDALRCAQRHELALAERVARRHLPGLLHEREGRSVARQAVEVRAMEGREGLEPLEPTRRLERFAVQLDAGLPWQDPPAPPTPSLPRPPLRSP